MEILTYGKLLLSPSAKIKFLDPAFGTGSFYSALLRTFARSRIASAVGYEIDPEIGKSASQLWRETPLELHVEDFTKASPPLTVGAKFNLLVCNPPYVRHHHLDTRKKRRLQEAVRSATGLSLNGLAGLYCYFLFLSHVWMAPNAVSAWLLPSEFMDVNYGRVVKRYLLNQVTLLRIHRFDPNDVQFEDALVSSAVVWFKLKKPHASHLIEFSYGGTLLKPDVSRLILRQDLKETMKWTRFPKAAPQRDEDDLKYSRVSDFFYVKRGVATGANSFFILTPEQAGRHEFPREFLRPVLPSARYLETDEIGSDAMGDPVLERRLLLLSCMLPENRVQKEHPTLWRYLLTGVDQGVNERYLCRHRTPWYAQEKRQNCPLLCTYMGRKDTIRGRPFRFILNQSNAIATNVYLMIYPKPLLKRKLERSPRLLREIWTALNATHPDELVGKGRVYGGGLLKLEPKELANIQADQIYSLIRGSSGRKRA